MILQCEDELICDLAETYHILNYRELSPYLVATLSLGLRDDSRVKMKLSGYRINTDQMLFALMVDNLQFLCWSKTKDATHGKNKPKSVLKRLMGLNETPKDELMSFKTEEEFETYMKHISEGK